MNQGAWDDLFHTYAALVRESRGQDESAPADEVYPPFRAEALASLPDWELALPVVAGLAAGATAEEGALVGTAWALLYLASDLFDHLEDEEFVPDRWLSSAQVASNLATGLIFDAFHTLAGLEDAGKSREAGRIFAACGLDAVSGQHRALTQSAAPASERLQAYWETTILKSGSVFRAAAEAAGAVGGADEAAREALADYGTALGVMLQLMDDCRDAFEPSPAAFEWQVTLPLLLFWGATGDQGGAFPPVQTKAQWRDLLAQTGVVAAIAEIILQWQARAVESLAPLRDCAEKTLLAHLPALVIERVPALAAATGDTDAV
jgi:hypothetical protein